VTAARDRAIVEQHLIPTYPALEPQLRISTNKKKRDRIAFSNGQIESIDTFSFTPAMRADTLKLLQDEHCANLRDLTLRDVAVEDLAMFSHLVALEKLRFTWAKLDKVTTLAPLAKLRNLQVLDVRRAPVADLAPLKKLPLKKLTISGTQVANLKPLAKHPTLECLEADGTLVADVRPLFSCKKLCNVSVWDARVPGAEAQALVGAIKANRAKPSRGADYNRYVSHNTADWYAKKAP
jgi:hypothetical protein